MKNKEKRLEDILDNFKHFGRVAKNGELGLCTRGIHCDDCIFTYAICEYEKEQWLEQEYKEPSKLTEDEKAILRNVDKQYKYIARDKNKDLYLYSKKPLNQECEWRVIVYGNNSELKAFNHLFQFISWEDDEPYLIEDLLNER